MNNSYKKVLSSCDDCFTKLYSLESILQVTKDVCQEKEFSSIYYNLPPKYKFTLSEERNHYINMLSLALDRVSDLKKINFSIENVLEEL